MPLDDITEWLDCDRGTDASEVMTDDAIVEYVKESPQNDAEEPEEAPEQPKISDSRAYDCISTFLEWLQTKNDTTPIEIVQAKNFRDKAQKHKNKSSQQKSIEHFFSL